MFCRTVSYLDVANREISNMSYGDEVFFKANWFSDEFEIRLAVMRHPSGEHDAILKAIEQLPSGERLDCPLNLLTERIILNPFSPIEERTLLRRLIEAKRPELSDRVVESLIAHA